MFQIAFAILLIISTPLAWAVQYSSVEVGEVVSIYDADTFRVNIKHWPPIIGVSIPIRVVGIDAPEIRGRCESEKLAARQAREITVDLLSKAQHIELRSLKRGKYFRLLADVWVDGQRLADQLILSGLARPYDGGKRKGWCL